MARPSCFGRQAILAWRSPRGARAIASFIGGRRERLRQSRSMRRIQDFVEDRLCPLGGPPTVPERAIERTDVRLGDVDVRDEQLFMNRASDPARHLIARPGA